MIILDVYTMGGCKLFQLLICSLTVSREVIEVNWWTWLRSDIWSALIVLSITLSDHSNWCLPMFTSHVTSYGPPSFVFIQMCLFWLLFILLSLEGWSYSGVWVFVTTSVITIGSGSLLWLQLVEWHANVSNSRYQTFHGVRVGADFITPTLLCLLPLSRLVFFVSIPLRDGCINCSLYEMYIFFCCSDLCPLLR